MTQPITYSRMLKGVFLNLCPRCSKGDVFSGIYSMHRHCPECEYRFEKEQGYFMGAVIAAYFIGALSLLPTLLVCLFRLNLALPVILALGTAQIIVLHPILFRFSKLTWLYSDARMMGILDGEAHTKKVS